MNFKKLFQDIKPHFLVIIAFFLIGYIYFIKTFNGYTHHESDVTQGNLKTTEIIKYKNIDGQVPGWTNSIFSGMPTTLIYGKPSENKISLYNYLTPFGFTAYPFKILFLSFIGFYLLMCSFKVKPLFGALAAVAYGFATYSISSIEAAHYTKVIAMALIPALIASLQWLFNGRYLLGGAMLAFNFALQIYYFHYQITFYSIICLVIMGIYYIIEGFRSGNIKPVLIATLISILAVGAGVLSNYSKIISTSKFADNTMRAGNDLAKADGKTKQRETGKSGLDRDYAFSYSYGIGETVTLLIPGFYGGSQAEKVSTSSAFYKQTQNDEAIEQGLPLYHGNLDIISGPIYIGSIIIFLFVLGLVIVKSPVKWAILAMTIVSLILGWGRYFGIINNFLFDYLPYFNKFRVPMMAFCIAQVTMPLLGFLAIKELYDGWNLKGISLKKGSTKATNSDESLQPKTVVSSKNNVMFWKNIQLTYYIVGGFCLLMAILGPSIVDMGGAIDKELNGDLVQILKEDRASLLRADAFRSFVFISIAFGLLWAWYTNKVQKQLAIGIIGAFAAFDLVSVDWRYLSWDDFRYEKGEASVRIQDDVDKQILSDKDLHYRVFDLTDNPFTSNEAAAFHKLIGGYDPAKLSRYQDVIAEILSKNEYQNLGLDMLNCKYLIGKDSNRRVMVPRPSANSNAWFVKQLFATDNAKLEMDKLKTLNVKTEATYNKDFKGNEGIQSTTFIVDSLVSTKLLSYHPDTLKYEVNNPNNGYLVFSEIYYDDWKVMLDGKETKLNKVNYTLRGLNIPAGKHTIVCYFNKLDSKTDKIDWMASVIILVVLGLNIVLWLKTYFAKTE